MVTARMLYDYICLLSIHNMNAKCHALKAHKHVTNF